MFSVNKQDDKPTKVLHAVSNITALHLNLYGRALMIFMSQIC